MSTSALCRSGIAEEAVGREILVGELLLLVLVARHALEPGYGRNHRKQQVKLGVLGHMGLYEEYGLRRVDAGCQPVDGHFPYVLLHDFRRVVVRGERMPVGHEVQALELVLQPDPVLEDAVIVAQVQGPGRAHAGKNAVTEHGGGF